MNTTFKKTLVATAILAFAGAANAATTQQTAVNYSQQGVAAATNIDSADIYVLLGAEYAIGDTLTITFPGATFAATSAPVLAGQDGTDTDVVDAVNDLSTTDATYVASDDTAGTGELTLVDLDQGITFGFLSSTSNSITYRVTELNQAVVPTTIRGAIKLSGVKFTASSVAGSKAVNVTYAAKTSTGVDIDVATANNGKLIAVKDQFAVDVSTKADAIIDVANDRLTFEADALTDTITLQLDSEAFEEAVTVDSGDVTVKLTGDFGFVDANGNGTVTTAELAAAVAVAGASNLKIASDLGSISFTGSTNTAYNVVLTVPDTDGLANEVIDATTFTADVTAEYGTSSASSYAASAGAWKLNGSQVRVPYMVVGGSRFGIIANVTNHGSKDGAISLDIFAEDGSSLRSNVAAGISKAGSVTSVAGALNSVLAAAGVNAADVTKFSFQVTTNVPEDDVIVYAAYTDNTTKERAIVNNDSKVQTK